jgi:hypothetical protein
MEGSGVGSGLATIESRCGSGRPKNIWILRIRIRMWIGIHNTGYHFYSSNWYGTSHRFLLFGLFMLISLFGHSLHETSGEVWKSLALLMIRHLLRCIDRIVALCPTRMLNTRKYLPQKNEPTSHTSSADSQAAAAGNLAAAGVTAVSG